MSTEIIFWLVVLVLMIVIEIATLGLTTIWFAGGALVAVIVAWGGGPIWLQTALFLAISIVLVAFTRPLAAQFFNKDRQRTNVEGMIGKKAIVISEIDNLRGIGQVSVSGQEWAARSQEESRVIPEGAIVEIVSVSGVKLIVRIDESMEELVPNIKSDATLDPRVMEAQAAAKATGQSTVYSDDISV